MSALVLSLVWSLVAIALATVVFYLLGICGFMVGTKIDDRFKYPLGDRGSFLRFGNLTVALVLLGLAGGAFAGALLPSLIQGQPLPLLRAALGTLAGLAVVVVVFPSRYDPGVLLAIPALAGLFAETHLTG